MAAWNGLFVAPGPRPTVSTRSKQWNRGRELVDGLGHCGACHTARNALGAEKDSVHLGGAFVDGWEAPALDGTGRAPLRWSEAALYDYLRHGHSAEHGAALGPMADVVRTLQAASDDDVRAMAHYLAALDPAPLVADPATLVADAGANAPLPDASQRLFESACGACHHDGDGPAVFGVNVPLALSTKLASDRPDNLLRTIRDGVRNPPTPAIGYMPAFGDALDEAQTTDLARYLRRRFAPQRAAWSGLDGAVARIRDEGS